jgi:signal transduction histidine kinase
MAVREIVHAFLTAEQPHQVFQFALERVSPLVGATFACVYLTGDDELMALSAVHNWPQRYAKFLGQMRVRLGAGPSGRAASERRAIEVPDLFADESAADWRDVAAELGFRSIVALPLQTGDTVLGTVTFYFADAGGMTAERLHLLRMVADQMAATAEKARLIESLRQSNAALSSTNAQLERQYAALLEARRAKDEFLSNISHELRTPLTAVIGYTALMQEGAAGPLTAEQLETLAQVQGASEQLLGLIADLLELTALKHGQATVAAAEIDPRDPLRDALETAGTRADDVELEVEMPDLVPRLVTDRAKLTRLLGALIANAYKFTPRGRVRVSLEITADEATYAVADTGIGIPLEAQRYVFEAFRQVDGSHTRTYGGSGLGLALARRLTQLLGGRIELQSTPGVGSTFRLTLPLACAAATQQP